jgi:pyruvate ferredoxin oxidoreductase gamma subunit
VFEVRIHGRGGQGAVTAAELLSVAAFDAGRHAQAFPSFGSERSGAPVTAFCRIAEREIRAREPIAEPDALIIIDPTLLHQVDVFAGLRPGGDILINSSRTPAELGLDELTERPAPPRVLTTPATEIAREHLGRPLPNVAMLGGFAALTDLAPIEGVEAAIGERFVGGVAAGNVAAARAAYDHVRHQIGAPTGA